MSSLSRLIVLSLLMLTILVVAGLGAQIWIQRQESRILEAARTELKSQLLAAIELTAVPNDEWNETRLAAITAVTGAQLHLDGPEVDDEKMREYHVALPVTEEVWLLADRPVRAGSLIIKLFQRVIVGFGVFALFLVAVLIFSLGLRPPRSGASRSPFLNHSHDIRSLSTLARTSVRQQAELDQERDDRLRAEADARQRLQLLNRALEEKIHIGRDLHDGVIQSLYAAGLTLESARQRADTNPDFAAQQINTTLELINRTIGEIRTYIGGLSPSRVRGDSLRQALDEVANDLRAGRPVDIDMAIEETIAAQLSDAQFVETIQIVREALSNALRHGGARQLTVSLTATESVAELIIRDDGTGFDPDTISAPGHGLTNMRARALDTGGEFNLTSGLGHGTTVRIHWIIPFTA